VLQAVQLRTHLLQGSMLSNLHAILAKHRSLTRFKYTCGIKSTIIAMAALQKHATHTCQHCVS